MEHVASGSALAGLARPLHFLNQQGRGGPEGSLGYVEIAEFAGARQGRRPKPDKNEKTLLHSKQATE